MVSDVACAAVKTWEDFLPEAAGRVEAATEEFGRGLVMMADDVKPDVYVSALKRWPVTPGATGRGVDDALRAEVRAWAARWGAMHGPPTTGPVHVGHQYGGSDVFTRPAKPYWKRFTRLMAT